jgi:hypothetical protein
MVTTPADIDSLKVYVMTATHAINGVASIVGFAMLVFALVATYGLQARAAGVLGVIGLAPREKGRPRGLAVRTSGQ